MTTTTTTREDFAQLQAQVRAAGCYAHAPWRSVASLVVHVALAITLWSAAAEEGAGAAAIAFFVCGSFFFYRLGWLMHDAAHGATFADARGNHVFASITAGVLGEFPSGWRYGHNKHHADPNVRGRDMDQAERWDPTRRYDNVVTAAIGLLLFSKYKQKTLPKTLLLLGLRDGYFCFRYARHRFRAELIASLLGISAQLAFFCVVFGVAGVALFFANTMLGMLYLNTVFAGNHYDKESFDEADADAIDFAALQVRTSRNYAGCGCPAGLGGVVARYVFGGLEHQIEHHLFPAMPRHHFARAAPFVRAWCVERGLHYDVLPFHTCIARMLRFHVGPPQQKQQETQA